MKSEPKVTDFKYDQESPIKTWSPEMLEKQKLAELMARDYRFLHESFFEPLDGMQEQCYSEAANKGWHPNDAPPNSEAEIDQIAGRLMCSHEEISELWNSIRSGKFRLPCDKAAKMAELGLPELTCGEEEFADRFIRLLDEAQTHGINMRRAVSVKMLFNRSRAHRHGGKTR